MSAQKQHTPILPVSTFDFLKKLQKNNNRDWFNARKELFLAEQAAVEAFADALLQDMQSHDEIETPSGKASMHRIYRDTRFSSDKTPYKNNWSLHFRRATKFKRGGYYVHLQPGNKSFIAGGFWGPNAEDLKRIREDIDYDAAPLRKIINSAAFKNTFGALQGEQLKKMPKGYPADHAAIDLLRYKQFLLIRNFTDEEVFSGTFFKEAGKTFRNMRPFFDHMSDVLSTDGNGA